MADSSRLDVFYKKCLKRILRITRYLLKSCLRPQEQCPISNHQSQMMEIHRIQCVLRRYNNYITKIALRWVPEGRKTKGKPWTT